MEKIEHEQCPLCGKKTLTLIDDEQDIPYFGKIHILSMFCTNADECNYKQSDIEADEDKEPCKIEFTIKSAKDLSVRLVKSGQATVKIPQMRMSVEPGVASEGYVSNIEGLLERFKKILESQRDTAEEDSERKTAKNLLKKLWRVECSDEELKIIIEDPSGNSAIISDKAVVTKLKGKK